MKIRNISIIVVAIAAATIVGLSLYNEDYKNLFLSLRPPSYVYSLLGLSLLGYAAFGIYVSGWEEAKPNEWLVIIQNGEQIKAGIGLICYRWFWQTAIKFPSNVQKVNFRAMQVCQEMQGLQISGFAIWSVHREFPFLFYRQMFGVNANQSIQSICESIVRHQISNTGLNTVMTQRDLLKDKMLKDLQSILKGWGVWIETVEITDVKICSSSLFEDMQTPSKQENYLKSELYKIQKQTEMDIDTLKSNHIIQLQELVKQTEREENLYQEQVKRLQQEASYQKRQFEYQKQKIQQESDLQLEQLLKQFELSIKEVQDDNAIEQKRRDQLRGERKKEILHEQQLTDVNLFLEKTKLAKKIYEVVKLRNLSINSYQPAGADDLLSIVPTLSLK